MRMYTLPSLNLDIDECAVNNPCKNGGTCTNTVGSYKCACGVKFTGRNCETGREHFIAPVIRFLKVPLTSADKHFLNPFCLSISGNF